MVVRLLGHAAGGHRRWRLTDSSSGQISESSSTDVGGLSRTPEKRTKAEGSVVAEHLVPARPGLDWCRDRKKAEVWFERGPLGPCSHLLLPGVEDPAPLITAFEHGDPEQAESARHVEPPECGGDLDPAQSS